jgi:copper ion binding protein
MNFMTKKIFIEGMSCAHCVNHVETALKEICGIQSVTVDLGGKVAVVELAHEVDDNKIREAVSEAGYDVVSIE